MIWCERGAACQLASDGSSNTNPKAHYVYDCPDQVEGVLNINMDCPGQWWRCDGKNVCPRSPDHTVPCKGGCGDMVGPDRVDSYHQIICETNESFIGCGQKYSICSKSQKRAHSGVDRCPLANGDSEDPANTSPGPPTPTPSYHACGEHETSVSGDHSWGTAPCGDATHTGYLCQINASDHEWVYETCSSLHAHYECDGTDHSLQASCSSTDSNGNSCTVTNFYACVSHTHSYPPSLVACGGASYTGCSGASSRKEHQVPSCGNCSNGYWTCSEDAHLHTDEKTCKRSGCGVTVTPCQNGPSACVRPGHPDNWHWL